jgi:hypothetical protein
MLAKTSETWRNVDRADLPHTLADITFENSTIGDIAMCKATLSQYIPAARVTRHVPGKRYPAVDHVSSVIDSQTEQCASVSIYDNNADIIEFLFNRIYGHREDVIISNVRLFSLLFLLDWTSAIHSDEIKPITTGRWLLGTGSPYSHDYYADLKDRKAFQRKEDEEIWQAKRRVLFSVNFEGEEREYFPETAEKAATNVGSLVHEIAAEHGVTLIGKHCCDDRLESGKLKAIDTDIINLVYSLDPLLRSGIRVDEDINLLDYAKRHREAFIF